MTLIHLLNLNQMCTDFFRLVLITMYLLLFSPEEEVCTGVDEDEVLETGLSAVLSNEGLNYLMYRAESPDSVRADSLTPTEDR